MDEHPTSALQYGHLGKAIYDPGTQSWGFSRTFAPPPHITLAGVAKTTVTPPFTASQSSQIENKSLIQKVYPELAACWSLVNNETLSHVIATTSETCDPLSSSLLDLGHAVDLENDDSGSRTVPIAVVASGECGNAISFYKIDEDVVDFKLATTTRIRVPSIREAESAEWSARGAAVRQICFARTVEEKPTWMAARFPHSTLVFRPLYHRRPVPVHICHNSDQILRSKHRNSRLDPNLLVEISNSETGGYAHAAVVFNPWYQKKIGIVDERGNWSIWEISGRQKQNKGNWTAACSTSGTLPWLDLGDGHEMGNQPRHDGWAAMEWAGDVNSFIVSDRRCPMLYRMESDQIYPFPIELGLKRKSEWILDVKRSACNVSHVFILTTLRVFWLDVNPSLVLAPKDGTRPSLFPRLSWRHFRDPEDTTLQLTSLSLHKDFYLVLYSRLNNIVLTFYCPTISEGRGDIEPIPDPFLLDIPLISEYNGEPQPSLERFSSLVFKEVMHLPSMGDKKDYAPSLRLIKLFVLNSHLSVHESIYVGPSDNNALHKQDLRNEVIRLKRRYPVMRIGQMHAKQSSADFIVDDCDESVVGPGALTLPGTGMSSITPLELPQWTIDYSQVYEVATGRLGISPEGDDRQMRNKSFQESLKELTISVPASTGSESASKTLLELLDRSPLLDDIDQNARDIEDLLSTLLNCHAFTHQRQKLIIQLPNLTMLPSTKPVESKTPSQSGLIEIYDQSVNYWLASLPHKIPGRTRIMKEKVIRSAAADFVLAQVVATRKTVWESEANTDKQSSNHKEDSSSYSPSISSRPRSKSRSSLLSHIPRENGHGSWASEDDGRSAPNTRPFYSSLAAFTEFTDERQRSVSQNVTNMLHHWLPGTDPVAYDWQRTVQALGMEELQRDSKNATPKRRLRKKTVEPSILPMTSTATAIRGWGSQPEINEPPAIRLQSSQVMEDGLPMTQVERGAFGGREAGRKSILKARKKKRAAGF